MAGDAVALVEQLHGVCAQAHVELLAGQDVGDGVVVACDLDVIVDVDPSAVPLGVDISLGGQRLHRGALERLEHRAPRAGKFLEGLAKSWFFMISP